MRPLTRIILGGKKEVRDWDFVRDKNGNIVIDESHPNWWQDKKNPDRHGIRIPVLDENGIQKIGAKKPPAMETGADRCYWMEQSKNCELWRSEWAKVCNEHLPLHIKLDGSSYSREKLDSMKADAKRLNKSFCRAGK